MFNQNMSLSTPIPRSSKAESPSQASYSISQHYHHSAHIPAKIATAEDYQSTHSQNPSSPDTKALLTEHNVDPSLLLTPQLRLFEQALPEQRNRLIELWRIAPPERTRGDNSANWRATTLAQEEDEARARYERKINDAVRTLEKDVDMQEKIIEHSEVVEPYMKSGYEILAERDYNRQANKPYSMKESYSPLGSAVGHPHALDPAFSSKEWWHAFIDRQPMEFQYGMLDQMNQFRPMEENEPEDEEMN